jgi:undecaprenyl-diphosphatase
MIEQLKRYDAQITLWINQNNAPWLDEVMWFLSSSTPFLLLIFLALFYAIRKRGFPDMWIFLGFMLLTFALSDRISVVAFKDVFLRLRPSHQEGMSELLNLYVQPNGEYYMGGKFGFVSSHAANFCALTTFVILNFKPRHLFFSLLLFAHLLIIYSRVYLGVHYVGDVLVGSIVGALLGWAVWKISLLILRNRKPLLSQ